MKEGKESFVIFTNDEGKKGVKNSSGKVIIPSIYDNIKNFPFIIENSFKAIATKGNKDYLINYEGKEVFEADELLPNLASICPARFKKDNKWGLVNSEGKIILDNKYDCIKPEANSFYFLYLEGKEGFIAPTDAIFEPIYDKIEIGSDEEIIVTLNGKKGYINEFDEFTEDRKEAYYNFMMAL